MIEKKLVIGKIDILEDGQLQVREDTVILDDAKEITRLYYRYVLEPGDDVKNKDKRVQDVSALIWTIEVITEFKRKKGLNEFPFESEVKRTR